MFNTKSETLQELLNQGKKVQMDLAGQDGNAFAIMGRFKSKARRADWDKDEIDAVLEEARSGDYNHLLVTMQEFSEPVSY